MTPRKHHRPEKHFLGDKDELEHLAEDIGVTEEEMRHLTGEEEEDKVRDRITELGQDD